MNLLAYADVDVNIFVCISSLIYIMLLCSCAYFMITGFIKIYIYSLGMERFMKTVQTIRFNCLRFGLVAFGSLACATKQSMYTLEQQVAVLSWMPTASKQQEETKWCSIETFVSKASGKESELEEAPAA